MNKLELSTAALLKEIIETSGVIGIKTSFEDEGASFNEVIRIKELCNQSGTKLFLKIAGAEAKRDIADSLIIGVKGIVSPMIESAFALDKFVKSAKSILPDDVFSSVQLGINIETIQAYKNFNEMVKSDGFQQLYHVTLGRVDFVSSMNKDRTYVNSDEIFNITNEIFTKSRELTKKVYLGGAITKESETFLKKLFSKGLLDKFETRYVIYDPTIALKDLSSALLGGQKLELSILRNRQNQYLREANKEIDRI
ncbi:MAG: aldolase/citrate lyase family protein, partial [Sediminibacterium sp.]|nr:aldolase/citrate lyase family protein [Sediminibacterium sp.]